jgi:hypothetical protein
MSPVVLVLTLRAIPRNEENDSEVPREGSLGMSGDSAGPSMRVRRNPMSDSPQYHVTARIALTARGARPRARTGLISTLALNCNPRPLLCLGRFAGPLNLNPQAQLLAALQLQSRHPHRVGGPQHRQSEDFIQHRATTMLADNRFRSTPGNTILTALRALR